MYIVSSSDSGETFSKATKLGTGEWKLNACPMDGGMIAMDSNAQWAAVWSRKGSVYRSTNESEQEQLLGIGGQPWVTSTQAGTVVVWSNPMERTLHVQMPNDSLPLKLADSAIDPVVVSNPNGDGSVVVFWETKLEGQSAILSIPLIRGAVKP